MQLGNPRVSSKGEVSVDCKSLQATVTTQRLWHLGESRTGRRQRKQYGLWLEALARSTTAKRRDTPGPQSSDS
eukprot:3769853-Prymnesium_polylepis.1